MFYLFIPKEGGLFGQLNVQGGMESTHFGKHILTQRGMTYRSVHDVLFT